VAEEVAGPLGLDTWIGLPPDHEADVARLLPGRLDLAAAGPDSPALVFAAALLDITSLTFRAFANPPGQFDVESFNAPELHQAEWPAANGITTAASLARLYGELACDRVLSGATLDEASRPQVCGPDRLLVIDTAFGLGFSLPSAMVVHPPGAFGHEGAGGSVGFADRAHGVGFTYVMNQLTATLGTDRRARRLVDALYSCL